MSLRLSLFAVALVPLAAFAAPFSNGNFESPGVAPGTFFDISGGGNPAPAGWVAGGTAGNVALFYENGAFSVIGIQGPNAVGFGGNSTTGATLSQTFDTVPGTTYTVNYFVTSQQGNATGTQSVLVQALNGAAVLGSVTDVIPDAALPFTWVAGPSFAFVATGATSTLRFTDTSNGPAAALSNWALDGVSVTSPVVSAVPEPETYALMIAGLALLGTFARRNRRR